MHEFHAPASGVKISVTQRDLSSKEGKVGTDGEEVDQGMVGGADF